MIQSTNPYSKDDGYVGGYKVEPLLGPGFIVVYDLQSGARKSLPNVNVGKAVRWIIMHRPSERMTPAKGRDSALKLARKIASGVVASVLLPEPEAKPPATEKAPEPARRMQSPALETVKSIHDTIDSEKVAMWMLELCTASKRFTVKDENGESSVIVEPDWQARSKGLDLCLKYKIGTPVAQKDAPGRAPFTLDELRGKMIVSEEYRTQLLIMVAEVEAVVKQRKEAIKKPTVPKIAG